jgi:hypothetical protein
MRGFRAKRLIQLKVNLAEQHVLDVMTQGNLLRLSG